MTNNNNQSPEQFITVPKFCAEYGLKTHAVRKAIRAGVIPAYTFIGNRRLVKPSEVLAEVKRLQTTEAQNV